MALFYMEAFASEMELFLPVIKTKMDFSEIKEFKVRGHFDYNCKYSPGDIIGYAGGIYVTDNGYKIASRQYVIAQMVYNGYIENKQRSEI